MTTIKEFLMGRHHEYPLTAELIDNMSVLLYRVNRLRLLYAKPMYVSSGYRPGHYNKSAGGAKKSSHLTCSAIDIKDPGGKLAKFILDNVHILTDFDLYLENPLSTPGWVHLDTKPRKTRVFTP